RDGRRPSGRGAASGSVTSSLLPIRSGPPPAGGTTPRRHNPSSPPDQPAPPDRGAPVRPAGPHRPASPVFHNSDDNPRGRITPRSARTPPAPAVPQLRPGRPRRLRKRGSHEVVMEDLARRGTDRPGRRPRLSFDPRCRLLDLW